MNKYRIGLIGLGKIAQGYGSVTDVAPYGHVGGILQSDKVIFAAAADPFDAARTALDERWGQTMRERGAAPALFSDVDAMLLEAQLDIVGVCVRGPMHFDVVRQILNSKHAPRAIFLEKPPFCSLQEADEIHALATSKSIPITVSYSRHWAPHVLKLRELVRDGLIGPVHSVVGYCGGAVLSFASHTTELICQFACADGDDYTPRYVSARGIPGRVSGAIPPEFAEKGYESEPEVGVIDIEFANGVTGIQIGSTTEHSAFYADVFGEKGMVRAGIYVPPQAFDNDRKPIDLSGYNFPADTSVFHVAYDQIADYLSGGPLPDCTNENWRQVNEIGFAAIESMYGAGRVELPNVNRKRLVFANG